MGPPPPGGSPISAYLNYRVQAEGYNETSMASETERIPLDRRVCVIREGRIDIRPERAAIVGPFIGLVIAVALFSAIAAYSNDLSVYVLAPMLLGAVVLTPFSAMGFIYSLIGAAVVIEAAKQSVRFHQGVLGLGLGTVELVPFWKVDHIEVEDWDMGEITIGRRAPFELRAWDIILVKVSGKRLPIAQVMAPANNDLVDEAWDRALDAAEAIGAMVGKPVIITAEVEGTAEADSAALADAPDEASGRAEPAAG